MQSAPCLPLTVTPQHHLQAPRTLLTQASHVFLPLQAWVKPCCLPSLSLFSYPSLTLSRRPAQLPDGRVLHSTGCGGQIGMSQAYFQPPDLLTLFEDD